MQIIQAVVTIIRNFFRIPPGSPDIEITGGPRGGPNPVYMSMFKAGNPGFLTNGFITINGPCAAAVPGDPIPITIAGESNYMFGIDSDVAGPLVVLKTFGGSFLRCYSPGDVLLLEIDSLGRLVLNLPVFPNNAAALAGGLGVGNPYRTGADPDHVCIVH